MPPKTEQASPPRASFSHPISALPTPAEFRATIPEACFAKSRQKALRSLAESLVLTSLITFLGWKFIPLEWAWLPVWVAFALVSGTAAMGLWVIAHECGHRAFWNGTRFQDAIGFVLHSGLLVPYFSWQRSHAVHHARTNHLTEGETHVPPRADSRRGARAAAIQSRLGVRGFGLATLVGRLLFGWPLYLLFGLTGGPNRGITNHFVPATILFPPRWHKRVVASAAGVTTTVAILGWWAFAAGSIAPVLALYVGPYLVVNAWLVTYTWLHHTDVDVPHLDGDEWSFMSGVFNTIDRPYGPIVDRLHHQIGTTHVAHHFDGHIPHYNARAATDAVAEAYPDLYRCDDSAVPTALWRVATRCHAVTEASDGWRYEVPVAQP